MELTKHEDGSLTITLAQQEALTFAKKVFVHAGEAHSPVLNFAFLLSEYGSRPSRPREAMPRPRA